jgi:hypothetical protein
MLEVPHKGGDMSTRNNWRDDDRPAESDDDLTAELRANVGDAYSEVHTDPAMAPVYEAGGGVAEGFEDSEALLIEHATQGGLDATMRILRDAGEAEVEAGPERGVYGDADHERSSEREGD